MRSALAVALACTVVAQQPDFNAQSRLVLVPTLVTDGKGRPVEGLSAADFVVLDNGRPQKSVVDTLATGVAPIALVVAVQSSGISAAVLEKVRKIGVMIQPLVTGERGCAALVSFAARVDWLKECTADAGALEQAFLHLDAGGAKSAAMLDAVHQAVERLRTRANSRRVLLLISESRDRSSETRLDAAIGEAESAGVTIYAATYSAFKTAFTTKSSATAPPEYPRPPMKPSDQTGTITGGPPSTTNPQISGPAQRVDILGGLGELSRLSKTNTSQALIAATGGAAFPFTTLKGLEEAIAKLGAELSAQYVLAFVPEEQSPGYHRIEVRLVRGGDVRIRARPGYWPNI